MFLELIINNIFLTLYNSLYLPSEAIHLKPFLFNLFCTFSYNMLTDEYMTIPYKKTKLHNDIYFTYFHPS